MTLLDNRGLTGPRSLARESLLRRGLRLEVFTVGWNIIEAIVAIGAGYLAGSVALIGFGLDSVVESISGVALYHRLSGELRTSDARGNDARERRALYFVGASFFLIAAYVLYEAVSTLWNREAPEHSVVGIALAAASLIVIPLPGSSKLRVAKTLGSRALAAEAMEPSSAPTCPSPCCWVLGSTHGSVGGGPTPLQALAMLPLTHCS